MCLRFCRAYFMIGLIFMVACKQEPEKLFTALDKDRTGVNFRNVLFEDGPLNIANYIYFYNGGGVAVGDINNDGLPDILFTGNMVRNRLFLNKGDFHFEDITEKSGVAEKQGWCMGATMADVNGDGRLDIYICRSADANPERRKNLLFINNGDLTFTERAEEFGLADQGFSTQAAFFDYDKDGDLDCFIINHSVPKYTAGIQDNVALRQEYNPDYASKLYRNDNGHFSDISRQAGISSNVFTFGLGLAISDLNGDGWPDVYVSNDFNEPDYLFINNRNGGFTESLSKAMNEVSMYSMGSDAADFNNDGLVDIATLDMLAEDNKTQKMHAGADNFEKFQILFNKGFYYQYSRNMLQKNNGDGTFSEIGQIANMSNTDWSWTPLFCDFDNDGQKDLFVTNGYVKDYSDMDFMKYSVDRMIRSQQGEATDAVSQYIKKMPNHESEKYMLRNDGNGSFSKVTTEWGLEKPGVSAGAVYADLDNDGDMDIVVSNTNDFASIYRNNAEKLLKNNFLKVELKGPAGNPSAIGSKIMAYTGNQIIFQEQMPVRGYQSSVDPIINLGLGRVQSVDSLIVIWPNDFATKLNHVKSGQTLKLNIADATLKWDYHTGSEAKYFTNLSAPAFTHHENIFNDFNVQPLLPHFLSRQGPCLAVGDVNGDGITDVFVGGAKGQSGRIILRDSKDNFKITNLPALTIDSAYEDVCAEFFDADGDHDLDLVVASGGYEFAENDPLLQSRLYINDGRGNFSRLKDAFPIEAFSASCVRAADADGDGDLDLFLGGRVIPGKYPLGPGGRLLINEGKGHFRYDEHFSALLKDAMITDAAWVDLNKDGHPELITVGEWQPIRVFARSGDTYSDVSKTYINFASGGWWNRIFVDDLNGDGLPDLVLGNQGLNGQFKPTVKEPLSMYFKDFDGNGSIDPIFCYYIQGVSYPAYSRDDLAEQLPIIKKKFLEYHSYADATINGIFSADELKNATMLKAELLSSVVLIGKPDGAFEKIDLPAEAQYAPVFAIQSMDANQDGKKDLLLAGNNSWTRMKFGKYDASFGTLLLGDGKGSFKAVPQYQTGLSLRGDIRSVVSLSGNGKTCYLFGCNDGPLKMVALNVVR